MSRTPGSGWGAGPLLYQKCPKCGKKKLIYDPIDGAEWYQPMRCTACKLHSNIEDGMVRSKYPKHSL